MPDIRDKHVQRAVADAYIANGGNKEQAVVAAGYSERYARGNAHKIVANSGVQAMISERNREIADESIADMREINRFWTRVMRDENEKTENRLKASENRAKATGEYVNNMALTGAIPVVSCGDDDLK